MRELSFVVSIGTILATGLSRSTIMTVSPC